MATDTGQFVADLEDDVVSITCFSKKESPPTSNPPRRKRKVRPSKDEAAEEADAFAQRLTGPNAQEILRAASSVV